MVSSYGVIEGGVVVNAVLAEEDFAADQQAMIEALQSQVAELQRV